jgi:hypothetical protein
MNMSMREKVYVAMNMLSINIEGFYKGVKTHFTRACLLLARLTFGGVRDILCAL